MKVVFTVSLTVLLSLSVQSALPIKRGDNKNSNLAVMLAYRPNSEIRTRDKSSNKSWTYQIDNESAETVNDQLLEALIKDRFAKRFMTADKKFVKRENTKDEDFESNESHENDDKGAKIVEIHNDNEDNKTCYKNTYKNVLNAFESALKSQIENYKKCVCQKKTTTTTTTSTTTTTQPPPPTIRENKTSEEEDKDALVEEKLTSAVNNKDDIICFHKQHAFMLSKILDRIPCKDKRVVKPAHQTDDEMDEFNGDEVKRAQRNNFVQKHHDLETESESIEIDVSEMTQKPKSTSSKSMKAAIKNSAEEKDDFNEKILKLLKEHLGSRKSEKTVAKKPQNVQTSPKKIKIRPRQVALKEESEEVNMSEESEEISQHEFMQKLQELFLKYQPESDETFPLQSGEHSAESTSRMPPHKSSKKSSSRNAVAENSDESTEAVVKLKNRKLEKERLQFSENSRKISSSANRINSIDNNSLDSNPKKSYRNSPRSSSTTSRTTTNKSTLSRAPSRSTSSRRTDDETNTSAEGQNAQRNNNAKKSQKVSKASRTSVDDRLAADFAKKISDFAKGKSPKKD